MPNNDANLIFLIESSISIRLLENAFLSILHASFIVFVASRTSRYFQGFEKISIRFASKRSTVLGSRARLGKRLIQMRVSSR